MRYYADPASRFEYPNGAVAYYTATPFRSLARIERCPCDDGVRRLVTITGEPDSYFSVPAAVRVRVAGKDRWVSGFVTSDSGVHALGRNVPEGLRFCAYLNRKNAAHLRPPNRVTVRDLLRPEALPTIVARDPAMLDAPAAYVVHRNPFGLLYSARWSGAGRPAYFTFLAALCLARSLVRGEDVDARLPDAPKEWLDIGPDCTIG